MSAPALLQYVRSEMGLGVGTTTTMSDATDPVEQTLSVGTSVLLQAADQTNEHDRVKATIRGWQRGLYVILDIPNVKDPTFPFRRGECCVLRYLAEGDACACQTEIQDLGSGSHFSYIRVRWPNEVVRVRVRKHWRVAVNVPCAITKEDASEHSSEMKDISAGGCKLALEDSVLSKDSVVTLAFTLPDGSAINNLKAVVTSHIAQPFGATYGCQFVDPDVTAVNDIEFFVATTLARLRISAHATPRILIIDNDAANANNLKLALKDRDYDLTAAAGVVDGFFALRLAPPALLLVGMRQDGLTATELCHAVRATRQFKELPIFVYGGASSDREHLLSAGATQWFQSPDNVKEIIGAVEKFAPQPPPGPGNNGLKI